MYAHKHIHIHVHLHVHVHVVYIHIHVYMYMHMPLCIVFFNCLKGARASPRQLFSWVARDCVSVMTAAIFLKQALY